MYTLFIRVYICSVLAVNLSEPTSLSLGAQVDKEKADNTHPVWPYILVLYVEKEKAVLLSRAHSHHVQMPSCCSDLRSSARIYFSCHITNSQNIS